MSAFSPEIACTFAGLQLDRADAQRQDGDWLAMRLADDTSRFLPLADLKPALLNRDGLAPLWLPRPLVAAALDGGATVVFLGLDQADTAHFAIAVDEQDVPDDATLIDVRTAAFQMAAAGQPDPEVAAIGLARTLLDWHERHRFCAVCGSPSVLVKGGYGRKCTNEACGADHFPRVDPVVIMLAVDGDRCVLGRQARFPPGMYSALAGFVEPGESLEEAVRRELKEESNIDTDRVRYVASQPWPFPSSLMIGCIARATSTDIVPDPNEIEHARWFDRAEVEAGLARHTRDFFMPPPIAIAHQILRAWIEG